MERTKIEIHANNFDDLEDKLKILSAKIRERATENWILEKNQTTRYDLITSDLSMSVKVFFLGDPNHYLSLKKRTR